MQTANDLTPPLQAIKRRGWWKWFALLGLIVVAALAYAFWPDSNTLTVSPTTTVITAPIAPDGLPDYVAYADQLAGRGIKPEQNVFIDLLRAVGPKAYSPNEQVELYRRLGIQPIPPTDPILQEAEVFDIKLVPPLLRPPLDPIFTWEEAIIYYTNESYDPVHQILYTMTTETDSTSLKYDLLESLGVKRPSYLEPRRMYPPEINARQEQAFIRQQQQLQVLWTKADAPYAWSIVERNSPILDPLAEALEKKSQYYVPFLYDAEHVDWACLEPILSAVQIKRSVIMAFGVRLNQRLAVLDYLGARHDLRAMLRVAGLKQNLEMPVDRMITQACLGIARAKLIWIITDPQFPREILEQIQSDWRQIAPRSDLAAVIDQGSRLEDISRIVNIVRAALRKGTARGLGKVMRYEDPLIANLPHRTYDWDLITRNFNTVYDDIVRIAKIQDFQQRVSAYQNYYGQMQTRIDNNIPDLSSYRRFILSKRQRSEALSAYFLTLLTPSLIRDAINDCRFEVANSLHNVLFALELHHRDTGAYPAALSDLVPKYLPAVPLDPFTCKELIYRSTGKSYIAYGVGPNLTDDGGKEKWTEKIDVQTNDYAIGTPDQVPTRLWFSW